MAVRLGNEWSAESEGFVVNCLQFWVRVRTTNEVNDAGESLRFIMELINGRGKRDLSLGFCVANLRRGMSRGGRKV